MSNSHSEVSCILYRTYGSSNSNWYVKFQMFMSARAFWRVSYFAVFCKKKKKVQVGKDQEKAQSEKDSHSKNQGGKKPNQQSGTYTMKTFRKPNEQLFSQ